MFGLDCQKTLKRVYRVYGPHLHPLEGESTIEVNREEKHFDQQMYLLLNYWKKNIYLFGTT